MLDRAAAFWPDAGWTEVLPALLAGALTIIVIKAGLKLTVQRLRVLAQRTSTSLDDGLVRVLAVLSNIGVHITAFVASLGIGGIALALAVQNILADLFASLAIAVDKPFEVGDSITVGDVTGTVERVGLKTTRIRSLGGAHPLPAG